MHILIVECQEERAARWQALLSAQGWAVHLARTAKEGVSLLDLWPVRVILLNLGLECGQALSVSVFAGYRCPDAQIVAVSEDALFTDGSIFELMGNVCAYVNAEADPHDIAVLVDHHGQRQLAQSRRGTALA